jgi:methyltransferase (TIGR00027 family)
MTRVGTSEAAGPSRTAMIAAMARASHLLHYGPRALLADWFAWPLAGADAEAILAKRRELPGNLDEVPICVWLAARSQLAEDWLTISGAEQYVILGAGLDSFAWRQPGRVRVFEVDQPSMQAWKRERVAALGMPTPAELVWTPVDFEQRQLGTALSQAGLDATRGVFVSWLGVVPYLTPDAIVQTLRDLPDCSLAVGYVPPDTHRDEDARDFGAQLEARVRELGEPWVTLPTPEEFAALLAKGGFTVIEDIGAHDIETRYGIPAVHFERMTLARKDS